MRKYFGLIVTMLICSFAEAQLNGSAAATPAESSNIKTGAQNFQLDPLAVYDIDGKKKLMSYADIDGSPFLNTDWQTAIIYDVRLHKTAVVKVRYNAYSDQIHFLDGKQKELVADKDIIRRIEILNDSANNEVQCVLEKGFTGNKNALSPDQFVLVLNSGKTQLLKKLTTNIAQKDSVMGTIKITRFSTSATYFLQSGSNCEKLRNLNQSELFSLLPNKKVIEEFEKSNKKKVHGEKDLLAFLNYYNLNDH
jgi:hypothetical protein